uniref:Uncharacterized protein n=1 Tax=Mycena chlorophos TaxID=658473 RepID=A0ABQ0KV53_MYCCL|nr:predicted protein [Mycena chlorophos]
MDRVSRRLHTRYPYTAPRLIPSRRSGNYLGSLRLRDFPGQYAPAPTAGRCDLPALRQIAHGGLDGLGLHAQIRDDGFVLANVSGLSFYPPHTSSTTTTCRLN